ncbi:MAG: hypothetical protein J0I66_02385, partial [Microbacterium sp.]|nr:hypothetical protein [Microbacterium sp.]
MAAIAHIIVALVAGAAEQALEKGLREGAGGAHRDGGAERQKRQRHEAASESFHNFTCRDQNRLKENS